MKRTRIFSILILSVTLSVIFLVYTSISTTMMYYVTVSELLESPREVKTIRVNGRVVPGSLSNYTEDILYTFRIEDMNHPDKKITIYFEHPIPSSFIDGGEVVVTGKYLGNYTLTATEVLTKCGSRYEAVN
jgi:cytochrome c-type biogenesis protein CcmE